MVSLTSASSRLIRGTDLRTLPPEMSAAPDNELAGGSDPFANNILLANRSLFATGLIYS